ncbi:alpha/beta hydrolase [Antribacter gilvus]|uniref:alpha/beta hydrolase n=1 Tax=Antribacter gilvus TaxID=2304675 RepID=UPI001F0C4BF5|nr:alpha/beta hydrolase [Antribacter gilvus]
MIRPARRSPAAVVSCVLATVLLLAACAAPPKVQTTLAEPGTVAGTPDPDAVAAGAAAGAPAGFEAYYGQLLEWTDCGSGFQCATADAPLSWQDAASGTIEVALKKAPARGNKVGSLLINPGGPGGSGVELVEGIDRFGGRLRDGFDIVGFDPRGVGRSTRVVCLDDAGLDEYLTASYPQDEEGLEEMAQNVREFGAACAQNTGALLGNVDTQSVARDLDMLRAVLGDPKLNYLGYSYGTDLGATYAGLFPDRVGRLVLDGAVDVTLGSDEIAEEQAVGFENALRAYVADCQDGPNCPLGGNVDTGLRQVRAMLDDALDHPIPTSGKREVTQSLAFYGVAVTLYDEGNWAILTEALTEVFQEGTGDTLLYLADFYNDRNSDGTFKSNSTEVFKAVGCLDDQAEEDLGKMRDLAGHIEQVAPTVGSFFAYSGLSCVDWPFPPVQDAYDVSAPGAAPIVVIGTTNDPATPYKWAEGLASTLQSGVLVTYEGEGHTAYGRSNQCIAGAVENYLVDGTVPRDGLTC